MIISYIILLFIINTYTDFGTSRPKLLPLFLVYRSNRSWYISGTSIRSFDSCHIHTDVRQSLGTARVTNNFVRVRRSDDMAEVTTGAKYQPCTPVVGKRLNALAR